MTQADDQHNSTAYVEALLAKRTEVQGEVERLRAEVADIAARLSSKEAQLRGISDLLALETPSVETPPAGNGSSWPTSRFIDAAVEVLRSSGKPMHYKQLADQLAASGTLIPGQNPAANLVAHMSRDARFGRGLARGTYGLSEWASIKSAKAVRSGPRRSRTNTRRGGVARG